MVNLKIIVNLRETLNEMSTHLQTDLKQEYENIKYIDMLIFFQS